MMPKTGEKKVTDVSIIPIKDIATFILKETKEQIHVLHTKVEQFFLYRSYIACNTYDLL